MSKRKIIVLIFIAFISYESRLKSTIKVGVGIPSVVEYLDKNINKNSNRKDYEYIEIDKTYEKTISSKYKRAMASYVFNNYSMKTIELIEPKVVVVHSTETKTLKSTINTFKPDTIIGRDDISDGGNINVGSHFIIDRDGKIYSFIPLNTIARHTIGLNHTAIGIENVGHSTDLTKEQLLSNIKLITYLKNKFPTIDYIIGHYEYNDKDGKHFYLIKQFDKKYKLANRHDPSYDFINSIRESLE